MFYSFRLLYSQSVTSVIPASPNVASLVSFTDIPVGKYTGMPMINIPIYTVRSGILELPVSLSYNASGIRTNQEASWVGLGWSLHAGGVISHGIRGQDDFDRSSAGYWKHPYPVDPVGDRSWMRPIETGSISSNFLQRTFAGYLDPEPDIFSFSFAGYSGKFYMDKNVPGTTGPVIRLIDQKDNLKIALVTNEEKFIITDGKGIQYYFGTAEYSNTDIEERNWAENRLPSPSHNMEYVGTDCMDKRRISALYLDKIIAPAGDEINFVYTVPGPCNGIVSQTYLCAQHYKKISEYISPNAFSLPGNFINYTYSKTLTEEVILQYINFKNGYVSFTATSERTDIMGYGLYIPQKLNAIGVADLENQTKREIHFKYSYFNNTTSPVYARLKLDEVYTAEAPYKFTYETGISLPDKLTNSVDHWGYYNGRSNLTIIPATSFDFQSIFDRGANREVNTDMIQAGILKEIEYPTGGKTLFEFECNDFFNSTAEPIYEAGNLFVEASQHYYDGAQDPFEEIDFYLPPRADNYSIPINASFYSNSKKDCEQLPVYSGEPFAVLVKTLGPNTGTHTNVEEYISNYIKADIIDIADFKACSYPVFSEEQHTYQLDPGWYRLVIQAPEYFVTSALIDYKYVKGFNPVEYSRKGAGLRVKKITIQDGVNATVTRYEYKNTDNTKSSGRLMTEPVYNAKSKIHLEDHYTMSTGSGSIIYMDEYNITNYLMIRSDSYSPLSSSAQGSYVGYDRVTEISGDNAENGKKVSTYSNTTSSGVLYVPPTEIITNGLLETETIYDAAGSPVTRLQNTYQVDPGTEINSLAFSVNTIPFLYNLGLHPVLNDDPFPEMAASYYLVYYYNSSRWAKLINTTTTVYTPGGNINTTTQYEYNPGNKKISREIKSLDNSELITKIKYPGDYNVSAGGIFKEMVETNLTDVPVEIQSWKRKNGTELLTSGKIIEYKDFIKSTSATEKFISPYKTYNLLTNVPLTGNQVGETSTPSSPYHSLFFNPAYFQVEKELNYDGFGNITSMITTDQVRSYIWGYNKSLPVAEAVNANVHEIFYNGFEDEGTIGLAHTGNKFCNGDYALQFSIPNVRSYCYSYWYRQSGVWIYSGIKNYSGPLTIADGDAIDDVRIYPSDARMKTYTHIPLVGISSISDENSKVVLYAYDTFARLRTIRDDKGNIIKKFCYNYAGLPGNCN